MNIDKGKLSTQIITILGILTFLYFLFKPQADALLTQYGYAQYIAAVAIIAGIIFNYAYPRLAPQLQEALEALKQPEPTVTVEADEDSA